MSGSTCTGCGSAHHIKKHCPYSAQTVNRGVALMKKEKVPMSSDRHVVRVSADAFRVIQQLAKEKEVTDGEAADYAIGVAKARLNALRKDAHRRATGKPATQRKVLVTVLAPKKKAAKK